MNRDIAESPLMGGESWVRLPKPRGGRLCGLSRTTLLELIDAELIKSAVIRKKGAKRGIRLVHMPSLLKHLDQLAEK
jgi:hypothetical protein